MAIFGVLTPSTSLKFSPSSRVRRSVKVTGTGSSLLVVYRLESDLEHKTPEISCRDIKSLTLDHQVLNLGQVSVQK